ncbi:MAG: hypothetical protein KDJ88_11845 [Bauldia sp.]|nr:hypothetical protein [Bauldia sp.]
MTRSLAAGLAVVAAVLIFALIVAGARPVPLSFRSAFEALGAWFFLFIVALVAGFVAGRISGKPGGAAVAGALAAGVLAYLSYAGSVAR